MHAAEQTVLFIHIIDFFNPNSDFKSMFLLSLYFLVMLILRLVYLSLTIFSAALVSEAFVCASL